MSPALPSNTIIVLPANGLEALAPPRLEVRQRRLTGVVVAAIAVLIAVIGVLFVAAWYQGEAPVWVVLIAVLCASGCVGLYRWLGLKQAQRPSEHGAWVLREDGAHLLVNFQSNLNRHFDPSFPSVLVLPRQRVRSLTVVRQSGLPMHAGDSRLILEKRVRRLFLDIAFDGDRETVAAALVTEAGRGGKTHFSNSSCALGAVSMLPGNVLRITWRDEHNRLEPGMEQVRRKLAGRYRFAEEDLGAQPAIKTLERAEQEARLLEMVARGERLQAIALAKVLYNMETSEAVDFVDGLR